MPTKLPQPSFVYPLKVSINRRFLVDQHDQPFLIHGDTAWSLITALDQGEAINTMRLMPAGVVTTID
jgi:hypothetical protein